MFSALFSYAAERSLRVASVSFHKTTEKQKKFSLGAVNFIGYENMRRERHVS
jgi:hypothetical protein